MRLAILLSGRGSNFAAIYDAITRGELDAEIVCVISNRPGAAGIEHARALGLPAHVIDQRAFDSRAAHEAEVLAILENARPDFIVLAGYMRLLSPAFIAAYPMRILNIHPSLLPAFPGVDAQAQAVAYGVRIWTPVRSSCSARSKSAQTTTPPRSPRASSNRSTVRTWRRW